MSSAADVATARLAELLRGPPGGPPGVFTRSYFDSEAHHLYEQVVAVRQAIETGEGDSEDLLDRLEKAIVDEEQKLARVFRMFAHGQVKDEAKDDCCWMWLDAGKSLFGGDIAELNPMRWTDWQWYLDIVATLKDARKSGESQRSGIDRPVLMLLGRSKKTRKEFKNVDEAIEFFAVEAGAETELHKNEVKMMNRYLGFPAEDDDIDKLMLAIDVSKSGKISFKEFENYVGWLGGSGKLLADRKRQIKAKHDHHGKEGSHEDLDAVGDESMDADLDQAGLDHEARSYWRMVVPKSEFSEAARMVPCQQNAVAQIRRLAKQTHQEKLPLLQARLSKLGYSDDQLWMTLAYIRELAPILLHINLEKMVGHMEKDTHYRNQFETGTSGGLLKPTVREKWEKDLFDGAYDKADGFDRPKYGVANVMNDHRGVVKAKQYGSSYLILKDVRLRCTFSPEDSANLKSDRLAVLDFYAHVLHEYSDDELRETMKVANSSEAAMIGNSEKVGSMKYKEAQIHGEVRFDSHVECLVAHQDMRDKEGRMEKRLQALCDKHKWTFSWMDEEQERMRKEKMHKMGEEYWKQKLEALQKVQADVDVPAGYCMKCVVRTVAPGLTANGNPFRTCCRGCALGFGHDRLCGQIDPDKVGPGLCKNGCGHKVAEGTYKGKPLTTCCRGCANGMAHDKICQEAHDREGAPPPGAGGYPA